MKNRDIMDAMNGIDFDMVEDAEGTMAWSQITPIE